MIRRLCSFCTWIDPFDLYVLIATTYLVTRRDGVHGLRFDLFAIQTNVEVDPTKM